MRVTRPRTGGAANSFLLLVLALLVGLASITSNLPLTPFGVQCPKAPIQTIQAPINCCGKIVGYELRAPRPGEPGFVQCHCADKRVPPRQTATINKLPVFLPVEACNLPARSRLKPVPAADTTSAETVPSFCRGFFHPPDLV